MPESPSIPVGVGAPAPRLLRYSAGFVYLYFGVLKFYTDLSPAELLASQTIMHVWPWPVDAHTVLLWLATAEVIIGLGFLLDMGLRWILWIFLAHQVGTFLPLVVYPELTFKIAPFAPTLEGQYILKNLVSFAAGLTVMLPAVRGRRAQAIAQTRPVRARGAPLRRDGAARVASPTPPPMESPR